MFSKKEHKQSNQKKSIPELTVNHELKAPYLSQTFIYDNKRGYKCQVCSTGQSILKKNLLKHVRNQDHLTNAKKGLFTELETYLKELNQKNASKGQKNKSSQDLQNQKNYMEFLAFCMKENLSFLQVQAIGKYLKNMVLKNEINFLKTSSFDTEEISEIARIFGTCLREEIVENLSNNKFSFSIDSVTVKGKNVCGIKVRYLKQAKDTNGILKTNIDSQIIGLKYQGESSDALTYYNIIKEKLFDLDERIKSNFIGIAHDHANVLSGDKEGLIGILNRECSNPLF